MPEEIVDGGPVVEAKTEDEGFAIAPNPEVAPEATEEEEAKTEEPKIEEANSTEPQGEEVEIDGVKYAKEELEDIFNTGKTVKQYQKEHPGFDPLLIHRDYTTKTMELADLKKRLEQQPAPTALPVSKKSVEEVAKELGVATQDIEYVQKIAKAMGFVDQNEIQSLERDRQSRSYETVKQEKVNEFVKELAQFYHPSAKNGDANWQKLVGEYSLFKMPDDPNQIGALLKKAHQNIFGAGAGNSTPIGKALAQAKINDMGKSTAGGGSASSIPSKSKGGIPDSARKVLRGFSEEELQEMFS